MSWLKTAPPGRDDTLVWRNLQRIDWPDNFVYDSSHAVVGYVRPKCVDTAIYCKHDIMYSVSLDQWHKETLVDEGGQLP